MLPQLIAQLFKRYGMPLLSGLAIVGGVMSLRSLGVVQLLELHALDWMLQLQPSEQLDERIIIVALTDADLRYLGTADISDAMMARLLTQIKAQRPRVIGLDFYRSLPIPPGQQALSQVFRSTPNLIGIQKVIDTPELPKIPGHPDLVASQRTAASDILPDPDGRVRRGLLFPTTQGSTVIPGLPLRLALDYLVALGIKPDSNPFVLTLAGVRLPAFSANDGGYIQADDGGYQVLLSLRRAASGFRVVTVTEVLTGQLPPDLMTDRIVLIGGMLQGNSDVFFTAQPGVAQPVRPLYGVELHAHLTSQILSSVLDRRPPLQGVSGWVSVLGVMGGTYLGIWIQFKRSNAWRQTLLTLVLLASIVGASYGLLLFGWWLPTVSICLALLLASALTLTYNAHHLKILATRDELTQVANRRTFNQRLAEEWFRALRSQAPLALILCDVDYFKLYNDTYGHPKGDECLRQVARVLRTAVKRSSDLVARYGGEEFVILLPNTDAQSALKLAEMIRLNLLALKLPHTASQIQDTVTLSLGVSSVVPSLELSPSGLINFADEGLYLAKQKGRNQAILKLPEP